jgi:hypothetical protein
MSAPPVEVTIDRIVLHGLPPGGGHEFAAALTDRLTALVTSDADADRWPARDEASRRLSPIALEGSDPADLGGAVGDRVFGAVAGRRDRVR